MNITVIGGSGFIGTELSKVLHQGHTVKNIDKNAVSNYRQSVSADVRNIGELRAAMPVPEKDEPAYLVLLAAEHRDDVSPTSLYYDVNVDGARNVVKVMEEKGINRIIFTSSVAVYGLNKENPDEHTPADPFNHYGKSKWETEQVLREWYQQAPQERTLIIIRPTVVFGPGNKGNVYNLLKQIATGRFMMIGKGENKKSMAYVENVVAFIAYCMDKQLTGYHVFNYVDKPDLSMKELVKVAEEALSKKLPSIRIPYWIGYAGGMSFDLVSKVTGKKFPISAVRVKKFCATTQFADKALTEIGFVRPWTLQKGLSKTIQSIIKDEKQAQA